MVDNIIDLEENIVIFDFENCLGIDGGVLKEDSIGYNVFLDFVLDDKYEE